MCEQQALPNIFITDGRYKFCGGKHFAFLCTGKSNRFSYYEPSILSKMNLLEVLLVSREKILLNG